MSLPPVDLASPDAVERLFLDAASANFDAACRNGSVDEINAPGVLIATGDLHDNPIHFARVLELAAPPEAPPESPPEAPPETSPPGAPPQEAPPTHVTLHEVIHSGRLINGVDLSHRALARVAQAKLHAPERVHTLLANHELSQIVGMGVVKDGVRMKDAFNEGVGYVFSEEAPRVLRAIEAFIRSMPLALLCNRGGPDCVLCAHSLPGADLLDRFDHTVLDRALTEEDYTPRKGAAHIMVWGRGHPPEHLEALAQRWGVRLFLLGHEKAEQGWRFVEPNAVVLNSDHEHGAALEIDLGAVPECPPPEPHEGSARGWRFHRLTPSE